MDGGKFFGAFRACSGIKGLSVINHTPTGCNWGASVFRAASNQELIGDHTCTAMHEKELVFGGEDPLKRALLKVNKMDKTRATAIVAGDVPLMIGDDVKATVSSLSLDKDIISIDAAGFKGTMKDGYEDALLLLGSLMREQNAIKNSINLIGLYSDDYKVEADVKEISSLMNESGIKINSVISNCSLEEFQHAPAAELNVVLGQGKKIAEFMKGRFGIPYIEIDYPYGLQGTEEFMNTISDALGIGHKEMHPMDIAPFRKIYLYLHDLFGTPVSIIGDVRTGSMAKFLAEELGFEINVCSLFEENRYKFEEDVRDSNTMILFGSSFERNLAREMGIPMIRFCYPVFDQVCVYDYAPYMGYNGSIYLTESIVNAVMDSGN